MLRTARLATTSTAAALLAIVAAAGPAAACHDGDDRGSKGHSQSSSHSKADKADKGQHDHKSDEGKGHDKGDKDGKGDDKGDKHGKGDKGDDKGDKHGKGDKGDGKGDDKGDKGGKGGKGGEHNPPGNNGTVKINDSSLESNPRNEPHVGCDLNIRFFGFDTNQHADVRLDGHAPSGSGLVWKRDNALISDDDASKGAQDVDAIIHLTSDDLDLSGLKAHAKQGYHLKLTVDVKEAPGGAKHKVFWLEPCEDETPAPTTGGDDNSDDNSGGTDNGTDNGGDHQGEDDNGTDDNGGDHQGDDDNGTVVTPGDDDNGTDNGGTDNGTDDNGTDDNGTDDNGTDDNGSDDSGSDNGGTDNDGTDNDGTDNGGTVTPPAGTPADSTDDTAVLGEEQSRDTLPTAVLGTKASKGSAVDASTRVLGSEFTRAATLPFTGSFALTLLMLLGLSAVLGGGGLVLAARLARPEELKASRV